MEEILSSFAALLRFWRVIISTLGSTLMAMALSLAAPAFTAEYCVTCVILGCALGCYWQSRADDDSTLMQDISAAKISAPIALLGLMLIGFICGGILALLFDSTLLGAAALLSSATLIALWHHQLQRHPMKRRTLIYALVALLLGYAGFIYLSAIAIQ